MRAPGIAAAGRLCGEQARNLRLRIFGFRVLGLGFIGFRFIPEPQKYVE